jgi:predicted amidophosphoribosyltransferase
MISLQGNWAFGFAFDLHTAYSNHLGVDENGNHRFENIYTAMGYLIHSFKYKNNRSALPEIIKLLDKIEWPTKIDFIIPIPPTDNTRTFQPVTEIAIALGQSIGVTVLTNILIKTPGGKALKNTSDPQKRENTLRETIAVNDDPIIHDKSILLIDDLYRSGATLRISTDLLMKVAKVRVVSVLTMTRTRSHR